MRHHGQYVLKRLLFVPFAALIVVTLAFGIVNLTPGDPARVIAGDLSTETQVQEIRTELGLNDPLATRFVDYLGALVQGDLGRSFYSKRPIASEIWQVLPNTIELILLSLVLAFTLGLTLGGLSAYFRNRPLDRGARAVVTATQSVPDFFIALLLIFFVFYKLGWAPAPVGRLDFADPVPERVTGFLFLDSVITGNWDILRSALYHSLLPVLTLGLFYSAYIAKITRTTLSTALGSKQVEFARACGLRETTVFLYALRAARTPILTYAGLLFAALLGGAALVETVFAWGGIGQWAITAILKLDVPAIQGFILVGGLVTLITFVMIDLLVGILDPRVSYD